MAEAEEKKWYVARTRARQEKKRHGPAGSDQFRFQKDYVLRLCFRRF